MGEITPSLPDDEISRRFSELWPREKPATRRTWSGQVKRFHREIEVEDTVVTYDPETRLYHLGDIQSSAEIRVRSVDDQDRHEFVRDVVWTDQCPRDGLSIGTRNTLGSSLTLFQVSGSAAEELLEYSSERLQLEPGTDGTSPEVDRMDDEDVFQEYVARSEQLIEDRIASRQDGIRPSVIVETQTLIDRYGGVDAED